MNRELIEKCIDLDTWRHSWHNKLVTSDDFKDALSVITKKIAGRKSEIELLQEGHQELMEWISIYECSMEEGHET